MFKIRLRWKFFIILLVFSLTPLIVVTVVSQRGTFRLGQAISDEARQRLTQIVGMELRQTAQNSAKVIQGTQATMEFYLQVLAAEAELAFMKMPATDTLIYFARDFEDPRTAPQDLLPSYKYRLKTHDGQFLDNPVSFNHPVFSLAAGVVRKNIAADLAVLNRMTPTFRKLSHEFGNALQWAHICLKTGVCVSYPGHSGRSNDYDPRWQPWYQNAKDTPTWSLPAINSGSGLLTVTVSKRLYRPDGAFWGVVAIDILFVEALKKSTLSPLWASDARSFITTIAANPTTGAPGLQILAQKDYNESLGAWTPTGANKWLTSDDKSAFNSILKQLEVGQTSYTTLPFQGAEFIWAYAAIDDQTRFVVMVPKSTIMALPEETRKTFFAYLKEQILFAGAATLLTIFFLAAGALVGSYMITRSLLQMATAAKKLSDGDFSVNLGLRTGDERDLVIRAFNQMGPKLADHLRLNQSMDLAMKVQQKLLPAQNPEIPGLDIAGKSIYCDETGGDYYDFLEYDPDKAGRVSVVLGDVSGHGISSALLMATARAFLRQRVSLPGTLGQIISDVNRQLAKDVAEYNNFMTLFYLRIDAGQKTLEWVRAGQDPAILYDPATRSFDALEGKGIPLGVEETWTYAEYQKDGLRAGQIIVMATDGFWESENVNGEMYGKEKIYELIRAHAGLSAKGILNIFIDSLYRFTRGRKYEDDVTLVVVKIK